MKQQGFVAKPQAARVQNYRSKSFSSLIIHCRVEKIETYLNCNFVHALFRFVKAVKSFIKNLIRMRYLENRTTKKPMEKSLPVVGCRVGRSGNQRAKPNLPQNTFHKKCSDFYP